MSFVVGCQCGKQFKVADEQKGRKAKCPGCGTTLRLVPAAAAPPPPPPEESDPFGSFDLEAAARMEREAVVDETQGPRDVPMATRAAAAGADTGPKQKPCPKCGAIISAYAMRCVNCNATFAPGLAGAAGGRKGARASGGPDADMSTGEVLLCVFCTGIACILGIVYLVQGKPKGGKMIGLAVTLTVLGNVFWFLVSMFTGVPTE